MGTAGGKIILCGEHAVVHGGDALVVGLARQEQPFRPPVQGDHRAILADPAIKIEGPFAHGAAKPRPISRFRVS